jgi:hypothetical protein
LIFHFLAARKNGLPQQIKWLLGEIATFLAN